MQILSLNYYFLEYIYSSPFLVIIHLCFQNVTSLLSWLCSLPMAFLGKCFVFLSSLNFQSLHVSLKMTLTASHNCPFKGFPQEILILPHITWLSSLPLDISGSSHSHSMLKFYMVAKTAPSNTKKMITAT